MVALKDYYNTGDDTQSTTYGTYWHAQTFKASSGYTIKSVKLLLYRTNNPGTVTAGIRDTSGGLPTGDDLCSGTTDGNTLPTGSPYEWREISFGTGYALTSGITYAIVLRAPSGSAGNTVRWRHDVTSPGYTDGQWAYSSNSGGSWTASSGTDGMFETYGGTDYTLTLTENMAAGDTITKTKGVVKTLTESMAMADPTVAKRWTASTTKSENMRMVDTATPSRGQSFTLAESMGIKERMNRLTNEDPDPTGRPDFYDQVSIEAVEIETIPINIVAQTIGVIDINIASQDASIDITIAAQDLDVTILAPTGKMVSSGANVATASVIASQDLDSSTEYDLVTVTGRGKLTYVGFRMISDSNTLHANTCSLKVYIDGAVKFNVYIVRLDTHFNGDNLRSQMAAIDTKYRATVVNPVAALTYVKSAHVTVTDMVEVGGFVNIPFEYTTSFKVSVLTDGDFSGQIDLVAMYGAYI